MATSRAVINTKSKFGVPLSGNQGSGVLMPKLKYRFRVSMLGGFAGVSQATSLTQNVVSVGRPTYTADPVEIHSYNSRVYVQGKHAWDTVELVVRDDISNSTSKLVGAQMQRQLNHFQQTTPAAGEDYKFDMQIEVLDGGNAGSTEVWFLEGCFFTSVNYGDHNYNDSEAQTITMTIRYDNATHWQGDNDINGRVNGGNPFPDQTPPLNIGTLG
jgi:hypothetical protein